MEIDKIREKLAIEISQSTNWINKLDDSNPGHYGVEDWDVSLSYDDIWVNIPQKTFSFKNAQFEFDLMIGSSNLEDGVIMSFTKSANGEGTFDFIATNKNSIEIEELEVGFDLDLF